MKIKKLETFTKSFVSFVKVTTDTGEFGYGQMSTYHSDITAQIFHKQIAPWVLGKPWDDFEDLESFILEKEHKFPGSYVLRAMAGLDTALWDMKGRIEKKPVVSLLGGDPGRLKIYGSSMKRDITPQAEADRFMRLQDSLGIKAFKYRIGAECGRNEDEWPGRSEEIIRTINKNLDANTRKLVDANSCFAPKRAIELGHILEDNGVSHYEEPCPYWKPEQTLEVTNALNIDVAGGEQDCDLRVWKDMIDRRIVNIIQPDIMYMGGLTRSLKVAKMAADEGIPCTPHAANLSLVTVCTMHFLKAIPNAGKYLEFSIEGEDYYPWQQNLFLDDPFSVKEGCVTITDMPGWGVIINPEWLENSEYAVSEIQ